MHFEPFDASETEKSDILKIQDGGGRHIEKSKNRHISATA